MNPSDGEDNPAKHDRSGAAEKRDENTTSMSDTKNDINSDTTRRAVQRKAEQFSDKVDRLGEKASAVVQKWLDKIQPGRKKK